MRIFFVLFTVLSIAAGPVFAICTDGSITRKTFLGYMSQDSVTAYFGQHHRTPFGRVHVLELRHTGEQPLVFGIHMLDASDPDAEPKRADILSVTKARNEGRQADDTHIAFRFTHEDGLFRWPLGTYSLLITACPAGRTSDNQMADATGAVVPAAVVSPLFFASGEHGFTTWAGGIGWMLIAALACVAIALLWARANYKKAGENWGRAFRMIFAGRNYRLSLSKFQLIVFSTAVVLVVAYVYGMTGSLTDLSEDVLFLLGISAASAATAAVADTMKDRLSWDNWVWLERQGVIPGPSSAPMNWSELVENHGEFDPARFQAFVFTIIVAPAFLIASTYNLADAQLPDGILAVLGLSQATYIVGKIVQPPSMSDFNGQVTKYRDKLARRETPSDEEDNALHAGFQAALGIKWDPANKTTPFQPA